MPEGVLSVDGRAAIYNPETQDYETCYEWMNTFQLIHLTVDAKYIGALTDATEAEVKEAIAKA